jgi:NAD+ diphosphatase
MIPSFQRAYPPAQPISGPAYWFPFWNRKLLVRRQDNGVVVIEGTEADIAFLNPASMLYLGAFNGKPYIAFEVTGEPATPDGWEEVDLRSLFGLLAEPAYRLAGYANHLINWQNHHHYCPNCAHPTEPIPASWGQVCPNCGFISYPTVTPAVLVLVHDGDKVLLVHKKEWGPNRRSIIAGFVEPGETLEECVRREVYEEVGLQIDNIAYKGSQPWPYPDQLMAGFTARYAGGDIRLDLQELDAAEWYRYDNLPELPGTLSLSYQIIVSWANSKKQEDHA